MIKKKSRSGNYYIGYSSNLKRRIKEHRVSPKDLVYYEAYRDEDDARDRECQLKKFKSSWGQLKKRTARSRI